MNEDDQDELFFTIDSGCPKASGYGGWRANFKLLTIRWIGWRDMKNTIPEITYENGPLMINFNCIR